MASWKAQVLVSKDDAGYLHFIIHTVGDDNQSALSGACEMFRRLTDGKEIAVERGPAVAHSEQDFDTKEWHHRGFVRFSLSGRDALADQAA